MRVIVVASRHWVFDRHIENEIVALNKKARLKGEKLLVVHGNEPVGESIVDSVCIRLGIDWVIHPRVSTRGDFSYFRRNQIMLSYHNPDLVLVFTHDLKNSTVCYDMLKRARAMEIKAKLVDFEYLNRKKHMSY